MKIKRIVCCSVLFILSFFMFTNIVHAEENKVYWTVQGTVPNGTQNVKKIVFNDISKSNYIITEYDDAYDLSADNLNPDKSVPVVNVGTVMNYVVGDTAYIQFNGTLYLNSNSSNLFRELSTLVSIEGLEYVNTSYVSNMSYMFALSRKLENLDLSNFNTSNVTNMSYMFAANENLKTLNISSFNTTNVTTMASMFINCGSLKTLNLSHFNTSSVLDMSHMFYQCFKLENLDVSSFDTSNATNMSDMFYHADSLRFLDLRSFNSSKLTSRISWSLNRTNLHEIYLPSKKNISKINISFPDNLRSEENEGAPCTYYKSDGFSITHCIISIGVNFNLPVDYKTNPLNTTYEKWDDLPVTKYGSFNKIYYRNYFNDIDEIPEPVLDPSISDKYYFDGWYDSPNDGNKIGTDPLVIYGDRNVYGKFKENDLNNKISSNVSSLNFGEIASDFSNSIYKNVTIKNDGNVSVSLSIVNPTNIGPFGSENFDVGHVLAPGESYTATLIVNPNGTNHDVPGTYNANYKIVATASDNSKYELFIPATVTITKAPLHISYTTHVQNIGWQKYVKDGAMAGTSGKAYRLEGIKIKLENQDYEGNIEYRTHIQNIGWEKNFKKNDEMSGTQGKAYRLEAIEIKLTGEIADHYDVYYRVHAENFGWLGWARNGEQSGTAGYAYRLEGIEIKLVKKEETLPEYGKGAIFWEKGVGATKPKVNPEPVIPDPTPDPQPDDPPAPSGKLVSYTTHVQNIGWQKYVSDGAMAGTEGKAYRLEGIKIKINNMMEILSIELISNI